MIFIFPQMHPNLLDAATRAALPEEARFLDPGLAAPADRAYARPSAAPFDARMARAILADTLRFGESLASPRDILAQALIEQTGALSPESSRVVQAEVERSVLGVVAPEHEQGDPQDVARKQAQTVLLLAWSLEERVLELNGAEARVQKAWSRLGESVSPGEGEPDDEVDHEAMSLGRELSGITLPVGQDDRNAPAASGGVAVDQPWRRLLEGFGLLAAPDDVFATADARIAAALADADVPEAPLTDMPGAQRVYRAQAWRMLGMSRLPEAKPWLAAPLTLGVFDAARG
ncbi:MAG: hypothetical protein AUJ49_08000 [Desulfovibrionaceae bacterium CG1_02_65_16]|nr:MAG: hypothetical protein AUJ49_08000 [Desulfovibrionaceae bacterium CG1_02_65_16]